MLANIFAVQFQELALCREPDNSYPPDCVSTRLGSKSYPSQQLDVTSDILIPCCPGRSKRNAVRRELGRGPRAAAGSGVRSSPSRRATRMRG
jgi:hypothetical protein